VRLLGVSALAATLVGCSSFTPQMASPTTGYSETEGAPAPRAPAPPLAYDHAYKGKLEIFRSTAAEVKERCAPYSSAYVHACALSFNHFTECQIYINEETRYDVASIIRHETGHCNGWPGNHPFYGPKSTVAALFTEPDL
jgi:hypothetical protein